MKSIVLALSVFLVMTGCAGLSMGPAEKGYQATLDGNWALAETQLLKAIDRNSNDGYSVLNLGWVMYQTDRPQQARSYYERVLGMGSATAHRAMEEDLLGESIQEIARRNLELLPD